MTTPSNVPANTSPSFLACLKSACDGAPESITKIVEKAIEIHNVGALLQYYEVKNPKLAYDIVAAVVLAAGMKLSVDSEAHTLGSKSISSLVQNAVAFGIIAGAHLAKEREL